MTGAARARTRPDIGQTVVYVYGVARLLSECGSAPLPHAGLVAGAPVERLVCGDLVAFVSALPADLYSESALQESFTDPDWLKERVIAHNAVVARLRTSSDILPFRFCTIYRDAAHAAKALAEHHGALCEAFDRVQDASEWAVKLYCDRAALGRRIETRSDAVRPLRRAVDGASPGARFFLQKRFDRTLGDEIAMDIAACVERSRAGLLNGAREIVEASPQSAAVHGRAGEMVLHTACLVDEQSLDRFRQAVAALQKESAGFVYEITGPWPPYHFVSTHQEGFDGAASRQ